VLPRRRARKGVTLAEVLVAMFVVAIGMLALLALFPVGALQMAQAIKDDRCGHAAGNATAYVRSLWKTLMEDPNLATYSPTEPNPNTMPAPPANLPNMYRFLEATRDVEASLSDLATKPTGLPRVAVPLQNLVLKNGAPGYPVFLDTLGFQFQTDTNMKWWLGGRVVDGIPRRPLPIITSFRTPSTDPQPPYPGTPVYGDVLTALPTYRAQIYRSCTLLDDFTFLPTGGGVPSTQSGNLEREGRFSWAYMIKADRINPQNKVDWAHVELAVIVYEGRRDDNLLTERSDFTHVNPASTPQDVRIFKRYQTRVSFAYTGDKPRIRRGSWVLDATMKSTGNAGDNGSGNGYFYRVVDVDDSVAGQLSLELQEPARADGSTLMILEGVREVFIKAPLRADAVSAFN
jgi:prepilin-type N-terminal cleavage/methylation domain-containing protein